MSHPVQAPAAPAAPASRRPVVVDVAAAVLCLMAVVGLGYAIATVVVAPGTVDRFRGAARGASTEEIDGFATVIWIGAALALVVAVILFALYVVLALGLRRGSNGVRIAVWVVCGLGLIAGCASVVTVLAERSGDSTPGTVAAALSGAYPDSWVGWNLTLAAAQMLGYVLVAALLALSPPAFFGRPAKAKPDPYAGAGQVGGLPVYGQSGHGRLGAARPGPAGAAPDGWAQPGYGQGGPAAGRPAADNPWAAPAGHTPGARPADAPVAPSTPDAATPRSSPDPDDDVWSRPSP